MVAILPVFILILAAIIILIIRIFRPGFSYHWLIAAGGTLIAWPVVILAITQAHAAPLLIPATSQSPRFLLPVSPALLLDSVSSPFALALTTLALAAVLTDIARRPSVQRRGANWSDLATSLAITAASILAILSGNLYTLLLAWSVGDLLEAVVRLSKASSNLTDEIPLFLLPRLAGIACVIWAGIVASTTDLPLSFNAISPNTSPFLLVAVGIRLGLVPVHTRSSSDPGMRRSLRALLTLAPSASCLMLLVRIASVGVRSDLFLPFLLLAGYATLYGSISWARSTNETQGQPYWMLGTGALAFAAAVRTLPSASLAWGVTVLLAGGVIFLYSPRRRWLSAIPLIGALCFSALPFTPAWAGMFLYSPPLAPILLLFLLCQGLLLGGYLWFVLNYVPPPAPETNHTDADLSTVNSGAEYSGSEYGSAERWVRIIYPIGLAVLPIAHIMTAWWSPMVRLTVSDNRPGLFDSMPAIAALMIAVIMIAGRSRTARRLRGARSTAGGLNSLLWVMSWSWLYRWVWRSYNSLVRVFSLANLLLEGRGGILWAFLLLLLLLSILIHWATIQLGTAQIVLGGWM
jgi:hypothetical protein